MYSVYVAVCRSYRLVIYYDCILLHLLICSNSYVFDFSRFSFSGSHLIKHDSIFSLY